MIESFVKYSGMDVELTGRGDVEVDSHHLVEDTGLVLGSCVAEALGDRTGIARFGTRVRAARRGAGALRARLRQAPPRRVRRWTALHGRINDFDVSVLHEFVRGYAQNAGISLHLDLIRGDNLHHIAEAAFKALGLATRQALTVIGGDIPSTKGIAVSGARRASGCATTASATCAASSARWPRRAREPVVSADPAELAGCDGVVLPGVGAFAVAAATLRDRGLDAVVAGMAGAGRPVLGVCLGFQLLFEESDEGDGGSGLGLLPGRVRRLEPRRGKVPHMGWNRLTMTRPSPLLDGIADGERMYFVHSYAVTPADARDVVATTEYGGEVVAAVERGAVQGTQFHPEKSGAAGLRVYANFAARCAAPAARLSAAVLVIPSVDVRGGRVVRLLRGDYARETVFADDAVGHGARASRDAGARRVHIVDLDAARGRPDDAVHARRCAPR